MSVSVAVGEAMELSGGGALLGEYVTGVGFEGL